MFKTLFQYTFCVAMWSLPVITVLLAASAEMVDYTVSRVEMDTVSIMGHYSAYTFGGESSGSHF